ncbi:MAG: glycosyltransferase [Candidatus Micrarchaeaceae archaeon]
MKKEIREKERLWRLLTVALFLLLSIAGFGFSVYLFFVARTILLYAIALLFLLLSVISGFFNIMASYWYYKSFDYEDYVANVTKGLKRTVDYPTVSVVIPTHDESTDMIRRNICRLKTMKYPKGKMSISVLNDSSDKRIRAELTRICKETSVRFIYRDSNKGFKAGAINNFLKYSRDEFVAIFDADEYLVNRNFLMDVIPYFQDKKIAFVQTEKRYQKGTFFSESIDIFDAFFFKFIETARAMDHTAIFSGSCGVIRRSVIDDVGGMPEYAIEDTFFSLESDLKGNVGFYLPKVYALGEPITTFSKLVKQQWRYNFGDTQFILYYLGKKERKAKDIMSKINYMAHGFGLNYLSVMLILFTILSTAIVFSSLPFAHISISLFSVTHMSMLEIAELLGLFAFLLSMFAPAILTKIYFKSFKKGIMVFLLNYALAFVRTKAAISVFFGKEKKLNWTSKDAKRPGILEVLNRTRIEVAFVVIMAALGVFALSRYNISGGVWLIWYGVMYSLTSIFLYKYG